MAQQSFWSSKDLEPKRQFRFIVSLQVGPDKEELRFACKTADRPSYTIGETEHRFFNHTFYYPGRMTWNTIGMTLVDAITPGSTELLYKYLEEAGIQNPIESGQRSITTTITKAAAVGALGDVKIREIGTLGGGTPETSAIVGEWVLINPFLTEVNFGAHSYDSDEMVEISLTFRYDWATYEAMASTSVL